MPASWPLIEPADGRNSAALSQHPVETRLSLTGPLIVARDIAHAKLLERLEAEAKPSRLFQGSSGILCRAGQNT